MFILLYVLAIVTVALFASAFILRRPAATARQRAQRSIARQAARDAHGRWV